MTIAFTWQNDIILLMKVFFEDRDDFYIDLEIEQTSNFHLANAMSNAEEILGYISFYVIIENNRKRIWLNKIATGKEHQNKGVGSKLLEFMECFARQKRAYYVEGRYFPENSSAKSFYENRGYSIEKDGYETFVCKNLSYSDSKDEKFIFNDEKNPEYIDQEMVQTM